MAQPPRRGSIDLFVGAQVPVGHESDCLKTIGDDDWSFNFRPYAPLQPFFDKTFALPDFELID